MGAPEARGPAEARAKAGGATRLPWSVSPLMVVIGAVALAAVVAVGFALTFLIFRGASAGTQEVVGSALPPSWQPGGGQGVGQVPPAPAAPPAPPAAPAPPAPEREPYLARPDVTPEDGSVAFEDSGLAPPEGAPTEAPLAGEAPAASFEPPRLLHLPSPDYPRLEERFGREGTVVLEVLVGENGRVLQAEVVGERLGVGFERAARRAAFAARFEPARRDGQPVAAETRIAIRFQLH